jgi:hypothetical protein
MDSDPQVREVNDLGSTRAENVNALNVGQTLADLSFGIVVSFYDEDKDAGVDEANHLFSEEEGGTEVAQLSIVDVARENDQVDSLAQGHVHQTDKSSARCSSELVNRRPVVGVQPSHGAVDV